MMSFNWRALAVGAAVTLVAAAAKAATVTVGIIYPITGPGASFGVPMSNEVALLPSKIGDLDIKYIVLDSKSDATQATEDARKLTSEDHVDVLWGEAITPPSLAMVPIAADSKTPMIATTAATTLVTPLDDQHRWIFKTVPNDDVGGVVVTRYMGDHKVKKLGVIGFNDSYLQIWQDIFKRELPKYGITITDTEAFERSATTTVPQALKLIASHPDAIFIAAGGTPAVIPTRDLRQRGFKGAIFEGHGIGLHQFIDQGGKEVEGVMTAAEPYIIWKDLPADSPYRKLAGTFGPPYKTKYNVDPPIMSMHNVDAYTMMKAALPVALKAGQPGTPEFRAGLRDGLENNIKGLYLNNGLLTNSPTDHAGFDPAGTFMIVVKNGDFHLVK